MFTARQAEPHSVETKIQPTPNAETKKPDAAVKKIGGVIYLSSNRPLHLPDFFAEFRDNWPSLSLEKTGKEPHRAFFRAGRSDFALELHHSQVPQAVTAPVASSTLHWPNAAATLARHVAHLELSGVPANHGALTFTCDLTRVIASLLAVTDSLAVCWLNGPSLNSAQTFISTAKEMFSTGLYPLSLWVAIRWEAGTLSTYGMDQFDMPEIALVGQPDAAPLMVEFLLHVALSLLTSRHPIAESIEGPHGRLLVKTARSAATGKKILVLEP